ncbi:MAG TPA: S-adenosylmethionine decarboxylase [Bacilli bacterium]
MAYRKKRISMTAVIAFILTAFMVYQLAALLRDDHQANADPRRLLYQVALFQMEVLNGYLSETGTIATTRQLDVLRQAAYAADYTHERLVLAVGEKHLTELKSIGELLEYILRLQIGGDRPLNKKETETLQNASGIFSQMFEVYGALFSSGGGIYSSQNEKLKLLDTALYEALRPSRIE